MASTRTLVTGATGKIGGAVAAQLLEKGVPTRALVHRDDERRARLRALGAEGVVASMLRPPWMGSIGCPSTPRSTRMHSTVRSPLPWPRGAQVWKRWWRWGSGW